MHDDYDYGQDYNDYEEIVKKMKIEMHENERKQSKLKILKGTLGIDVLQSINKIGER
jgi:hypothetical protein|tara:strand:+ start:233 stop:403 length:171 start_codon:yes stop_codon:yes gene_type:complete